MNSIACVGSACRGCAACKDICPAGAIKLLPNAEGFLFPRVDESLCLNCGLCLKICPAKSPAASSAPVSAFAARVNDDSILTQSSSGGVFSLLAARVIESGGSVIGASLDDESRTVCFIAADTVSEIGALRASKYVQADASSAYASAQKSLKAGKPVLFSGCPCQVAAMRNMAGDNDKLFLVDILCHGVPSPLLFQTYMKSLDEKHGAFARQYKFRTKTHGWGMACEYSINGKTRARRTVSDPYGYAFLKGRIYRECCYQCPYANRERAGDITLGDYWGVLKEHPSFYSEKGVSAVLINTEKGAALFESVKPDITFIETSANNIARHNLNLNAPTPRPRERNAIYDGINGMTPSQFVKTRLNGKPTAKELVKAYTPWRLKKLLSGVMK